MVLNDRLKDRLTASGVLNALSCPYKVITILKSTFIFSIIEVL